MMYGRFFVGRGKKVHAVVSMNGRRRTLCGLFADFDVRVAPRRHDVTCLTCRNVLGEP